MGLYIHMYVCTHMYVDITPRNQLIFMFLMVDRRVVCLGVRVPLSYPVSWGGVRWGGVVMHSGPLVLANSSPAYWCMDVRQKLGCRLAGI
jgi:hypothetical protein